MFDAGFLEFLLIGVIALLVVGPERLPKLAAQLGRWIGKARAFVDNAKRDIEKEINASEMRDLLDNQRKEIDELKDMVSKTSKDFTSTIDDAKDTLQSNLDQVAKPFAGDDNDSKSKDTSTNTKSLES